MGRIPLGWKSFPPTVDIDSFRLGIVALERCGEVVEILALRVENLAQIAGQELLAECVEIGMKA